MYGEFDMANSMHIRYIVIGFLLLIFFGLSAAGYTRWVLPSIESMSRESEIRRAITSAVNQAADARDSEMFRTRADYLRSIAEKLREGWPGFVSDRYHPSGYSERHMLGELDGALAHVIWKGKSRRHSELRALLSDLEPADEGMNATYRRTLALCGLSPGSPAQP